jgi:ABC-type multidrug transport system fused ATPase/permease subunit
LGEAGEAGSDAGGGSAVAAAAAAEAAAAKKKGSRREKLSKGAGLQTTEERMSGSVESRVWRLYIAAASSFCVFAWIMLFNVAEKAGMVLTDWWIVFWSEGSLKPDPGTAFFVGIFFAIAFFAALMSYAKVCPLLPAEELSFRRLRLTPLRCRLSTSAVSMPFAKALLVALMGVWASKNLHAKVLETVFYASSKFFEETPSGRILNRFSKDVQAIDEQLPQMFEMLLTSTSMVLVRVAVFSSAASPSKLASLAQPPH